MQGQFNGPHPLYLSECEQPGKRLARRLKLGADDYLVKPFSITKLITVVKLRRPRRGVYLAAAGIALYPTHGAGGSELIARADAALDAISAKGEIGYRLYTGELGSRATLRPDRTASLFRAFQDGSLEMRYCVEVKCGN